MTEAYDLRSNIKGKPGSQGTLFQVKDKGLLNPEQRWPRGYTPERQAEVSGALGSVKVTHKNPIQAPAQRARVTDALAKSTVPTSDLRGLKSIGSQPEEHQAGVYYPARKHLDVDMVNAKPNQPRDQTLVHELGHHVDNSPRKQVDLNDAARDAAPKHVATVYPLSPNSATSLAFTQKKVRAGMAEASADSYLTEHYRSGGRKSQGIEQGAYERNFTPAERDRHFPGYNDVRPPQPEHLNPQQFATLF